MEAGPECQRLEEEEGCWGRARGRCGQGPCGSLPSPPPSKVPFFWEASGPPSATRPGTPGPSPAFSLQRLGSAGFSAPGCMVLTCSLPWGRQPLYSRMYSAAVPWELERHLLFAWEKGEVGCGGAQYLLELRVGGVAHKLQNEPLAGGEEGAALAHPGQRHQPVHLAEGVRERVSASRSARPDTR